MPRDRICFKKCQQNSVFLAKINLKFQRCSLAFLLIFTVTFLSACGGGEEATPASSDSLTRSTRIATTTDLAISSTMTVIDLASTGEGSFTIPQNTLSFALFAIADTRSSLAFKRLLNPSGENVLKRASTLQRSRQKRRTYRRPRGMDTIQIPIVPPEVDPTHLPTAGRWTFTISRQPTTLKLAIRTGTLPTHRLPILHIQPFITGDKRDEPLVNSTLQHLKQIYKKAGIQIKFKPLIRILDKKFTTISARFKDPTTAELLSMGVADRINLFFVKNFKNQPRKMITLTGTPGVFGFKNRYNGILLAMASDTTQRVAFRYISFPDHNKILMMPLLLLQEHRVRLLARNAANGIGHFLGLQATMNLRRIVDLLPDTPKCSGISFEHLYQGYYNRYVCPGKTNLMFPIVYPDQSQEELTPQQIYVLKQAPMVY